MSAVSLQTCDKDEDQQSRQQLKLAGLFNPNSLSQSLCHQLVAGTCQADGGAAQALLEGTEASRSQMPQVPELSKCVSHI